MTFLWATRGQTWGFRFLRNGGFDDPLPVYDRAFTGAGDEPEVWHRPAHPDSPAALRFPDPLGRRDRSGRVIPHEFVVLPPLVDGIYSVDEGVQVLWGLVADEFGRVWDLPEPPSAG
ncbi:hypothetical protein [Klenkia terrae]|uniref:Uncharacterized protein n=1 Tax=Klenkia terrae TaxID=1052259 RepID=A0ABU8EC23_9ACTN|nr:hypothetical protein [Klenkia terrae]SSC25486.1 Hypothetical protein KLENKIAIHU_4110 [Klenkia terrae]